MYTKMLVPLDGSQLAEGVLCHVREMARCTGARILLLRVIAFPHLDYLVTDPGMAAALRESMETEARAYLEQVAADLRAEGFDATGQILGATGPIADTIIDFAHAAQVDLIAMSTHGRTGPARWLLGSIADRVVRGARMPVLMIRPVERP